MRSSLVVVSLFSLASFFSLVGCGEASSDDVDSSEGAASTAPNRGTAPNNGSGDTSGGIRLDESLCAEDEQVLFTCQRSLSGRPLEGSFISVCGKGSVVELRHGVADSVRTIGAPWTVEAGKITDGGPGTSGDFATFRDPQVDQTVTVFDLVKLGTNGTETAEHTSGMIGLWLGSQVSSYVPCAEPPTHALPAKLPASKEGFDSSLIPK